MKITLGTLVLCYLISSPPDKKEKKIVKLVGTITDIAERDVIYDKDSIAYIRKEKDIFVKGINRKGLYRVKINACKPLKRLKPNEKVPIKKAPSEVPLEKKLQRKNKFLEKKIEADSKVKIDSKGLPDLPDDEDKEESLLKMLSE